MQIKIQELAEQGFILLPPKVHGVPVQLIKQVTEICPMVMRALRCSRERVAFSRAGEGDETDIGLTFKDGFDDSDRKSILHYTHELVDLLKENPRLMLLVQEHAKSFNLIEGLQQALNRLAFSIFGEIREHMKVIRVVCPDLQQDFLRTTRESLTFSTTVLRSLWYERSVTPVVAQPHFDRDALSLHLGDQGGGLLAHREYRADSDTFSITPPPGYILAFVGLRLAMVTQGVFMPVYHSAWAEPGEERQASVQFCNLPEPVIPSWKASMQDVYRAVHLQDAAFRVEYRKRMCAT